MTTKTIERRAQRPPSEARREAPFGILRSADDSGEPDDGLTLDGYGAVFGRETVIDDWEGRYREIIAGGSMKRSFRETPPKIQFDHGRHPLIGSIPIAALRSVTEDSHPELAPLGGAHIVGRVFDNWLMLPVRDAIASDPPAINGMSFRFSIIREGWQTADGKAIRDDDELMRILRQTWDGTMPDEELPLRTLKELQVPEMGPVVWPAYSETSVGMRSAVIDLGRLRQGDPEQRKLLAEAVFIADTASQDDTPQRDTGAPAAPVVERQEESDAPQQDAITVLSVAAVERQAKPKSKIPSAMSLRLRNNRDRLQCLREIGERPDGRDN